MPMQTLLTYLIVAVAAVLVLRTFLAQFRSDGPACGSCSSCDSRRTAPGDAPEPSSRRVIRF